jgi:hypothetical protein
MALYPSQTLESQAALSKVKRTDKKEKVVREDMNIFTRNPSMNSTSQD